MCFHDKPTRNDQDSYGVKGRAPSLREGDALLFDECGRCSPQVNGKGSTDYHSHHFRLVQAQYGGYRLLVRHGGGDERHDMGHTFTRLADLLLPMDSDSRYLMMHALYDAQRRASNAAMDKEREHWQTAAAEKRIRTRKVRGQNRVKVWIMPRVPKV